MNAQATFAMDSRGMLRTPDILLPEYMALHAQARPGAPALIGAGEMLSWAELVGAMDRVAALLQARGIGRGDTVGVLGSLTPKAVAAQYGVLRAGAAIASLSTAVNAADLKAMVLDCGARAVIASEPYGAQADLLRECCPGVAWVAADFTASGWTSAWAMDPARLAVANEAEDVFSILYSSGTTSAPKGIVLTHASRINYSYMMGAELGWGRDAVCLIATALHSNTSWSQLNLSFLMGGAAVLMAKFDAALACDLAARHRVSHTILVPAQYAAIVQQPDAAFRLASLRTACTVGSLMAPERKRAIDAMLPGRLHEVYGLTEGLVTILRPGDLALHPGSVGRPMMGNDIRILDSADAQLPTGGTGEIVGCSPFLMRGYLGRLDATADSLWHDPASGRDFLRSGDIGRFDTDGFLHLVDRKKDMIVSGAANIYPADIERVLLPHPDVADACVIGVPHPRWDETPLALVVRAPGAAIDAETLRDWANARLGRQQRLSAVEFRDSLPRNAAGKIIKRALRAPYWPSGT